MELVIPLTIVCLLILFFLDERLYILWKIWTQRPKAVPVGELSSRVVWEEGPSFPLSRRSVFNPSIHFDKVSNRWLMISRFTRGRRVGQCLLQYTIEDDLIDIDGLEHRASMLLQIFDMGFNLIREIPVYVRTFGGSNDCLRWQGEDPRFFTNEIGELQVQATLHEPNGKIRLAHGPLRTTSDGRVLWNVSRVIKSSENQKNWGALPDGRRFLTNVFPEWRVASLDSAGYQTTLMSLDTSGIDRLTGLRCTSGCKQFTKSTLLTCLHSVHPYRTYLCEIDSRTLKPLRISPPLEFCEGLGYIEFPSGLEVLGEDVFLGVGINDIKLKVIKLKAYLVGELMCYEI